MSPNREMCVCGHEKSSHIYEEGACRPGFECRCEKYQPNYSTRKEFLQSLEITEEQFTQTVQALARTLYKEDTGTFQEGVENGISFGISKIYQVIADIGFGVNQMIRSKDKTIADQAEDIRRATLVNDDVIKAMNDTSMKFDEQETQISDLKKDLGKALTSIELLNDGGQARWARAIREKWGFK